MSWLISMQYLTHRFIRDIIMIIIIINETKISKRFVFLLHRVLCRTNLDFKDFYDLAVVQWQYFCDLNLVFVL